MTRVAVTHGGCLGHAGPTGFEQLACSRHALLVEQTEDGRTENFLKAALELEIVESDLMGEVY